MTMDPAQIRLDVEQAIHVVAEGGAGIEQVFLDVGDSLGRALDSVAQLTERVEAVPDELAGAEMQSVSEKLGGLSSEMTALAAALPQEGAALAATAKDLDGLRGPLDRLRDSIRTIAILARSSRVESANLSTNRYNFVEFAEEVSVLADRAQATIGQYLREYGKLSRAVSLAKETQSTVGTERGVALRRSVESLDVALREITDRQHRAIAVAADVAARSRHISAVVGEAIIGLQAGDSTRQRLEHVVDALGGVAPEDDADRALAECGLQGVQLVAALDDVGRAVSGVSQALRNLGGDAEEIVGMGRSLLVAQDSTATLHDLLRQNLAAASSQIRECELARESVDSVIGVLAGTLQSFRDGLSALTEISAAITTAGLNAAIKSARLGPEGRALAVISQDLRFYADRIVEDTKGLLATFESVIASAAALDTVRSQHGASRMSRADGEIGRMLQTLAANEAVLRGAFDLFASSGADIGAIIGSAEARYGDLATTLAPCRAASDTLRGLGRLASAQALAAPAPTRRYSMASEREIHVQYRTGTDG